MRNQGTLSRASDRRAPSRNPSPHPPLVSGANRKKMKGSLFATKTILRTPNHIHVFYMSPGPEGTVHVARQNVYVTLLRPDRVPVTVGTLERHTGTLSVI